jgi:hypothetical protein
MTKKVIIVVGILALLGVAAYVYVFNKPRISVDTPDFLLSANSLIDEYERDEDEADKKYLGKVVQVSGTVTEVLEQGDAFVLLMGDSTPVSRVSCSLQEKQDTMAYGLRPGDELTVKGICTGRLLDVVLVDCLIVDDDE